MPVLDGYLRLCHVPWRGESVRGRSRLDFSTPGVDVERPKT
jgi:hypothetical protein